MQILLTISYDGAAYAGWQSQPNAPTVQQTVETALGRLYRRRVQVRGASRTDAGVHALGQRAAYAVAPGDFTIPTDKLPYAVNTMLPDDIRVVAAEIVPEVFDPIKDAKQKTYEYRIYNKPFMTPCLRGYCEHARAPLDIAAMAEACEFFVGEYDFAAFCATGGSAKTTIRTVYSLTCEKAGDTVTIRITGNGFLYNMVRIIAGTLLYVGMGKIPASAIPGIIASRERVRAGKTLSAKGLTLVEVRYD